MSKRYTWEQNKDCVIIHIAAARPILKQGTYDIDISPHYVKLHLQKPKLFIDFDLCREIDPTSNFNRTIALDNEVQLVLGKQTPNEKWSTLLVENLSKADLLSRREQSIKQAFEMRQSAAETKEDRKHKLNTAAVREQMWLDKQQQDEIGRRKVEETNKAIAEIFGGDSSDEEEPTQSGGAFVEEIFDEDEAEIPDVRNNETVTKLGFTPKIFPHAAARETYEPPKPKPIPKPEGELDETHPIWLKDKGNEFFNKGDYESAINAYTEGLKADNKHMICLLNRSACYLKLHELENALKDIETLESFGDLGDKAIAVCNIRKAAIYAWGGNYDAAIALYKEAAYRIDTDEGIAGDMHKIEIRKQSQIAKEAGDKYYRQNQHDAALEKYQQALEIDPTNEIALSNIAQCYLKLGQVQECLDACETALPLVTYNKSLWCKVLMRKAKALKTRDIADAKKVIEEALRIEPSNKQAFTIKQTIEGEIAQTVFKERKEACDAELREGKIDGAIQSYRQLLRDKLTRQPDLIAAVRANMCVCYLYKGMHEDVVQTAERGLTLEPNNDLKLRLLSRKAKAHSELGQVHNAIRDIKAALEFDPENPELQADLDVLYQNAH